jgi:hypothetical protein
MLSGMLSAVPACGSSAAPATSAGSVLGQIEGTPWTTTVANAYWVGKPFPLDPAKPVVIRLFDTPTACSMLRIEVQRADTARVLQLGLSAAAIGTFAVPDGAYLSPWQGGIFPDATDGAVVVSAVAESTSIVGTFDAHFGFGADRVTGTFDAKFCAEGQ